MKTCKELPPYHENFILRTLPLISVTINGKKDNSTLVRPNVDIHNGVNTVGEFHGVSYEVLKRAKIF